MQEVAELCLADSCNLFQSREGEDACILREEAGRIVAELDIYILKLVAGSDVILLHCFEGSEKVLYSLLDGLAFPDAPELKRSISDVSGISVFGFLDKYFTFPHNSITSYFMKVWGYCSPASLKIDFNVPVATS